MGSTLLTLRNLLANQISADEVTDSSDPSISLLNTYINEAIRVIARRDRPRELMTSTAISADITINTNAVTIPTTIMVPESVYYKDSSGKYKELKQKPYKELIQIEGNNFFDSTNTGDPTFYAIRGTSIITNKYYSRTEVGALKLIGINIPTTLSNNTDTTELPIDYDMLITYEAAFLFAQREDDAENIQRWMNLSQIKRAELRVTLQTNTNSEITMDPNYFTGRVTSIGNPSVYFSS